MVEGFNYLKNIDKNIFGMKVDMYLTQP